MREPRFARSWGPARGPASHRPWSQPWLAGWRPAEGPEGRELALPPRPSRHRQRVAPLTELCVGSNLHFHDLVVKLAENPGSALRSGHGAWLLWPPPARGILGSPRPVASQGLPGSPPR